MKSTLEQKSKHSTTSQMSKSPSFSREASFLSHELNSMNSICQTYWNLVGWIVPNDWARQDNPSKDIFCNSINIHQDMAL
jgi:hypothetical protein